jgi:hypothetical protein
MMPTNESAAGAPSTEFCGERAHLLARADVSPTEVAECRRSNGSAADRYALAVKEQLLPDLRIVVET